MTNLSTAAIRRPFQERLGPGRRLVLVAPGAASLIELARGERAAILDPQGGQGVLLAALPRADAGVSPLLDFDKGAPRSGDMEPMMALLSERQRGLLARRGRDPATAPCWFVPADGPGERLSLAAGAAATLIVAAPLGEDRLASELEVAVERAAGGNAPIVPEPLWDPVDEFIVDRRTARAYALAKGQFVQIVDIEGRQCSDFQAFPRRALDAGQERFIDTTVSRSMIGRAYPAPGLCDKFFDQDVNPLVDVVQDTCGRHDTFGLACTQRIYERMGYFGHVSCSDNISAEMAAWDVAPRPAWSAINFFFNTQVGQDGAILADESWSRPGDHVLMRAATDLVCVSTACPDDTSPINGWNPTDILVRIYDAGAPLRRKTGFRMNATAATALTRETGFHPRTHALTRHYRAVKDLWIPTSFGAGDAIEEYWATREAATIQDLSQISKTEIVGPDAERLMDYALPRDVTRLAVGRLIYSPMLRPNGDMVDDGTLFRLAPTRFRWMSSAADSGAWLGYLAREQALDAHVRVVGGSIHNVAVQGPAARDILARAVWTAEHQPCPEELRRFQFLVGRIGEQQGPAVLVSNSGYTGLPGYEVFCAPTDAVAVWDAIMDAGTPRGLRPMGLDALDMLRIEAGLPALGSEFSPEIDPREAGVGFAVSLKRKSGDFVGRAALESSAPRRVLTGLILATTDAVPAGSHIFGAGDAVHGVVTSSARSPRLGCTIALARMAKDAAETGGMIEIGLLDGTKRAMAELTTLPFGAE